MRSRCWLRLASNPANGHGSATTQRYVQNNAPLFSCPICAKSVTVVFGSAINLKPFWAAGVNGGLVGGVVTVSSMVAEFSTKSPLKVAPLVKDRRLPMPFHRMRSDWSAALTRPKGCSPFKLFDTVNASNTLHKLCISSTASPLAKSTCTFPSGISIVHISKAGEVPGSYECGPNGSAVMLSIHIKANAPLCLL